MANYNTVITPEAGLACTPDEAQALAALLDDPEGDAVHGFTAVYEDGEVYLEAEENGTPEELPEAVFEVMGTLITRAGKPYLEFGCAWTCSRLLPGSHGGTFFRILADGALVSPQLVWPGEIAARHARVAPRCTCPDCLEALVA